MFFAPPQLHLPLEAGPQAKTMLHLPLTPEVHVLLLLR